MEFDDWFNLQFYPKVKDNSQSNLEFLRYNATPSISFEQQLISLEKRFSSLTDQEHLEIRNRDFDWILNTACELLFDWSLSSKLKNQLFLPISYISNHDNLIQPPEGLPAWYWQFQTSADYAKMIRTYSQHELENSQYLKLAKKNDKRIFLDKISKQAEAYCKEETKALEERLANLRKLQSGYLQGEESKFVKVKKDIRQYNEHFNWLIEVCIFNQTAESRRKALDKLAGGEDKDDAKDTRNFEVAIRNLLLIIGLPINKNFKIKTGNPNLKNQ